MKEKVSNPSFSLLVDDLIVPPMKENGWNPTFSVKNGNLGLTRVTAPFSDHQMPPGPNSRSASSSSPASSLSCSPISFLSSPSESSFHRLLPSSAIPFSWEHKPGIPKLPADAAAGACKKEPNHLPLPPVLQSTASHSRKKRFDHGNVDPFAAALARCAKDAPPGSGDEQDICRWQRATVKSVGIWQRGRVSSRIGLVSFYGSCKTTCAVSEATVVLPREIRRTVHRLDM